MALRIITRRAVVRLGVLFGLLVIAAVLCWALMIRMPGKSWSGPLDPLTDLEQRLAEELRRDVSVLAVEIGPRGLSHPGTMERTVSWISASFARAGYEVRLQEYEAAGHRVANVEAELPGGSRAREIVVLGAHYDTPGAVT